MFKNNLGFGDDGTTSFRNKRLFKFAPAIECLGDIDELNSWLGLLRDSILEHSRNLLPREQPYQPVFLSYLQLILQNLMSDLSQQTSLINTDYLSKIEQEIRALESEIPPIYSFVCPGGSLISSQCHIARTVARRAERSTTKYLWEVVENLLPSQILNRISDYLFLLAIKLREEY